MGRAYSGYAALILDCVQVQFSLGRLLQTRPEPGNLVFNLLLMFLLNVFPTESNL